MREALSRMEETFGANIRGLGAINVGWIEIVTPIGLQYIFPLLLQITTAYRPWEGKQLTTITGNAETSGI